MSDPTLYRTIIGNLVYLTITHPNIAFVVHIVSQFVVSPTTIHWAIVLHILRYLQDTIFQSLLFLSTSSLELHAYSNVDLVISKIVSLPLDFIYFLGILLFLGRSRNRLSFLNLPQKLSIGIWLLPPMK